MPPPPLHYGSWGKVAILTNNLHSLQVKRGGCGATKQTHKQTKHPEKTLNHAQPSTPTNSHE